jgi:thioredoxin reductase (NADPH)
MVHQFEAFTANKQAQEKLFANKKISTLFKHEPRSFVREGDKIITEVEDLTSKRVSKLVSDGVFVFIGMKPNIDLFRNKLTLDQWGYIKTNEDMQTSIPGVYAVGDVISKKYRQITTAVADGTIAAIAITKELH